MRPTIALLILCGVAWPQAPVADAALDLGTSTSASFTTPAFTVGGGSNRLVLLGTNTAANSAGYVTGVTYNSTPMFQLSSQACNPSGAVTTTLWYQVAPATGPHTFIISSAGGTSLQALALSYTGASQSAIPNAITSGCFGQVGGDTIYTVPLTCGVANCMLVLAIGHGNYNNDTGTIQVSAASVFYLAQRPTTTAGTGSISLESIFNGGTETGMITVALAPAGSAPSSVRHKSTILP